MSDDLQIIDTHAHLCDRSFESDLSEVILRARESGVKAIITVAETLQDARRNLVLAARFSDLKPAAGLYPEFAGLEAAARMIGFIREHRRTIYAVGEVGLDYWIAEDEAARELQQEVFRQFIKLARDIDLPLNVHSRSAGRHAVDLLLENHAGRVQLHAFDGRASAALPAVEAGYYFSVPPSVVRSRQKQKLIRQLPLGCLLVESDSPVLGPNPGSRNEPANVLTSVQAIAELKDIEPEQVLETVYENTCRLYRKL